MVQQGARVRIGVQVVQRLGLICILVSAVVTLSGCREQIVHDLSESEANRVMSRLHARGIHAEKVIQADGRWAVGVDDSEMVSALMVLDSTRVLARRQSGEHVKGSGSFVPSREEQWFRYESSIAAALEATIITLPGVLEARVHLNLPQIDPILGVRAGSLASASVLILTEPNCAVKEDDVAAIVAGGAGVPLGQVRVLKSGAAREPDTSASIARLSGVVSAPNGAGIGEVTTAVPEPRTPLYGPLWIGGAFTVCVVCGSVGVLALRRRRRSPFELRHLAEELKG